MTPKAKTGSKKAAPKKKKNLVCPRCKAEYSDPKAFKTHVEELCKGSAETDLTKDTGAPTDDPEIDRYKDEIEAWLKRQRCKFCASVDSQSYQGREDETDDPFLKIQTLCSGCDRIQVIEYPVNRAAKLQAAMGAKKCETCGESAWKTTSTRGRVRHVKCSNCGANSKLVL